MAVELDHDAIKERIVAILKTNVTLFDVDDLTKVRAIEVGFPEGDSFDPENLDQIFITNSTPFESIRNDGVIQSDAISDLEHTFNYDIVTVVNASTAREAEEKLDDFQKLIMQELEADTSLTGTGSRLVDLALPVSVQIYRAGTSQGKPVAGRVITLRCVMNTK